MNQRNLGKRYRVLQTGCRLQWWVPHGSGGRLLVATNLVEGDVLTLLHYQRSEGFDREPEEGVFHLERTNESGAFWPQMNAWNTDPKAGCLEELPSPEVLHV